MIDATEHVQLERIEEAEGDFYAQLLFLVLHRLKRNGGTPYDAGKLADMITEATKDMNERVARRTGG